MVRRNMFTPPPPPGGGDGDEGRARFPNTGAMSGVKSTLKELSSNAVREIDPSMIEEAGPQDRLAFADSDVADLTESLRRHGQQVPIMVRPIPEAPGRYRVVYGRRRLKALRLLGMPAKALVRSLDDTQAVLAQGQENALRLDPSFIEKALFAAELQATGYEARIILDALAVDKPMLSRMLKVVRLIPVEAILAIGPAHGIGRRRWEELAVLMQNEDLDVDFMFATFGEKFETLSSDARFDIVAKAASGKADIAPKAPARPLLSGDGTVLGEIRDTGRSLTLKINRTEAQGFADWLRDNAEQELARLHAAWKAGT